MNEIQNLNALTEKPRFFDQPYKYRTFNAFTNEFERLRQNISYLTADYDLKNKMIAQLQHEAETIALNYFTSQIPEAI